MTFVTHSTTAFVDHTSTNALTVRVIPATNLAISNANILDSSVPGTVVGTMSATFAADSIAPTWALTASANGKYAIDATTGIVTVAGALTPGTDSITVRVEQGGKVPVSAVIAINVTLKVIATNILFTPNQIVDLAAIGTVVGTATSDGQSYVWSLIANPGGRWAINAATGAVMSVTSLVAGTDVITIKIAFGTKSYSQSFSIVVSAPTVTDIILPLTAVYTNAMAGQAVSQVSSTGSNLATVTYSIPSGHDGGGMFSLSSDGLLSIGSTALVAGSQTIQITASPIGGSPVTQSFIISIQNAIIGFQLLSYPTTAQTNGHIWITGGYTGSAPSDAPSAFWSGGSAAVVSGWSASNNQWSCAITTPSASTGSLTFTIGGVTSDMIAMSAAPLDLPFGLNCPSSIVLGQSTGTGNIGVTNGQSLDGGNNVCLGGFAPRGFAGIPTVSISDTVPGSGHAANFGIVLATNRICVNGTRPYQSATPSWQITLTATDGITNSSVDVTVNNPSSATPYYTCTGSVVLDTANATYPGKVIIGSVALYPSTGNTTLTLTDPANVIQYDSAHAIFYVSPANQTAYGAYPVTITVSTGSGSGFVTADYATTFFVAHQRAPYVQWVPSIQVFNNTPAMTQIGNIAFLSETWNGGSNMVITTPVAPLKVYVGVSGSARIVNATISGAFTYNCGPVTMVDMSAAGNYKVLFLITDVIGGSTLLSVTVPIATGVTLPSTNITYSALPNPLDNSMAWLALPAVVPIPASPLLLTTMAVTGFATTPTWYIEVKTSADLPDRVQSQELDGYGGAGSSPPRYTFNGPVFELPNAGYSQMTATATSGVKLWASHLSAQTDHVYITCDDGMGTRCTRLIPVVVSEKVGPNCLVGPGQTYTTVNSLLAAWWANRSAFNGATVTLMPGFSIINPAVTDGGGTYTPTGVDITYSNVRTAAGYLNGFWPGPVTLRSPVGSTVRTVLDWQGGNAGNLKSGLMCANFDMTVINLEICNTGNGDNCPAVAMESQLPGNLTLQGCYIHGCDNGILGANSCGKHVVINDCIFQRNGNIYRQGSTHNMYIGTCSSLTVTNTQTDQCVDDHCVKSRAMVSTVSNSTCRQGAQATYTGVPFNFPLGGIVNVSDCIIINGANPDNTISFESGDEQAATRPCWAVSSTTITNNTFYNITAPTAYHAGTSGTTAIAIYTGVTASNGSPLITTYSGNKFYNYSHAYPGACVIVGYTNDGFPTYYGGYTNPIVDGGGNTTLTTYSHQSIIDSLTGLPPVDPPLVGYMSYGTWWSGGLMDPNSLRLDFIIDTAPPLGTVVCNLTAYDSKSAALTNVTYTMLDNSNGKFSFGTAGTIQTATASIQDGLYFVQVQASGLGVVPSWVTGWGMKNTTTPASSMTTPAQWIPIMVGTGYVPPPSILLTSFPATITAGATLTVSGTYDNFTAGTFSLGWTSRTDPTQTASASATTVSQAAGSFTVTSVVPINLSGFYFISLSNNAPGANASPVYQITVEPPTPALSFTSASIIGGGANFPASFSGTYVGIPGGFTYLWSNGGGSGTATVNDIVNGYFSVRIPLPATVGTYTLTLTGTGGNTASATLPGNTVVASSLSVNTPATLVHGTSFTLTGTFTGSPPSLVDVQFDAAGFMTISSVFATVGNMWVASTVTAPAAGSHTVSVRDSNAVSVVSAASGSFTVT